MCLKHQIPMEQEDHSECPIELVACSTHRDEQLHQPALSETCDSESVRGVQGIFEDDEGHPIVGFCLWCGENFQSSEEVEAHNSGDMAACSEFQKFKRGNL